MGGRKRTLIGFAVFGIFWGVWGASLPGVQDHARAGNAALGLGLALIGVGGLLSMRLAGAVLDRIGPYGLPATGFALAFAALLPQAATTPVALAASLALLGAASGAFDVAVNAEGTRYETAARAPLMSLGHAFFSAGVVAGSLGTAVARAFTPSLWLPFAIAAVGVAAASALFIRLPAAPAVDPGGEREALSLTRLPRRLLLLGALGALAYFVENAWQSWGAEHLHRSLAASGATAALAPACFGACAVAGRLVGQRLASDTTKGSLLAGGAAIGAVGTLAAAAAGHVWVAFAAIAVAGFGTSVCAPSVLSLAGDSTAASVRASAISIVTSVAYLGFLLGPAFVGVVSAVASLRAAFVAVAFVAAALSVLSAVTLDVGAPRRRIEKSRT